jgi:hypothetical protein
LEDLVVNDKIILTQNLRKWGVRMWAGLFWGGYGPVAALVNTVMNLRFS